MSIMVGKNHLLYKTKFIMDQKNFANAFYGKQVLVTGHTGFKGSWLSIWLTSLGANVIGFSLDPPTEPSIFHACRLERRVTDIRGDIRYLDQLLDVFERYQPEFVFHLAAQPIVRDSYLDPKLTFDTNIGGTVNILEAVRQIQSVKVFVNVTSDKCYENQEWVWEYRENDRMGGHDPYSASKGCSELVFSAYRKSFFSSLGQTIRLIGMASARAGNVIGGGDWAKDRLLPDIVRALTRGHACVIRNPSSIRPWQHVLEPLSGYLWLGALLSEEPDQYSGAWNFGPNSSDYIDVREVADKFIEIWGTGCWSDGLGGNNRVHEANILKLSCAKARSLMQWRSILNFDECLQLTAEWYKQFYSKKDADMYHLCKEQIAFYTEKASEKRQPWSE